MGYLPLLGVAIGLIALSITWRNFRLGRFPRVRCRFNTHPVYKGSMFADPPVMEAVFEVEVESWGVPIWDMTVHLYGNYGEHSIKSQLHPDTSPNPNPMNVGQIAKFRIFEHDIEQFDRSPLPGERRPCGLSELPKGRVFVIVCRSGNKEVTRIERAKFGRAFQQFDRLKQKRDAEATKTAPDNAAVPSRKGIEATAT